MKKTILLSSVAVMSAAAAFAQTNVPQSFNYQGAARTANGTPLANRDISLRLAIVSDSPNGTVEYYETRRVRTNALGLYSVAVGSGISEEDNQLLSSGGIYTFKQIAWGAGVKYFKVEVDPNAGNDFALAGASPISAVPYALYAERGGSSAFNYWVSKPENAGKTEADFIAFLKEQAATGVTQAAKNLTADSDGILTIEGGDGAVLNAATIKLDKTAFDKAARQAAIDGLNGKDGGDGTGQALKDAVQGAIKDGLNGADGKDGALAEAVNTTVNNLINDGKINGKDAAVNNNGTNQNGEILAFNAGNQAVLKDLQLILDKSALNNETKQAIIDALAGKDGANGGNGANGIDGKLAEAIKNAIKDAIINGKDGAAGANGIDGELAKAIETVIKESAANNITVGTPNAALTGAADKADAVSGTVTSGKDGQPAEIKLNKAGENAEGILSQDAVKGAVAAGINEGTGAVEGVTPSENEKALAEAIKNVIASGILNGKDGANGANGANGISPEIDAKLADAIKEAIASGILNGKDGKDGANGVDAKLADAIKEALAAQANKSLDFANAADALATDAAAGKLGTITPGKDGEPATINLAKASETLPGVSSLADVKKAVVDGITAGKDGKDGVNGDLAEAIKNAIKDAIINGKDGKDGVDGDLAKAIETIIKENAANNLTVAAPGAALTGDADKADAVVGTITPGKDNAPATLTINAAAEKAKGVVSNEDIKTAITNGLNAANTAPAGTNAGDSAVNKALNDAIGNAIKNGTGADGNTFAKKLTTESFITVSKADNKALLEDLTLSVDQNKLNQETAKALAAGLTPAPTDGTTNNPLADAIKDAITSSIKNGAAGTNGNNGTNGLNGKDAALSEALKDAVATKAGESLQFGTSIAPLADGKGGTITAGTADAPATINLAKAGDTTPGVITKDEVKTAVTDGIKAAVNGTDGAAGANGANGELGKAIQDAINNNVVAGTPNTTSTPNGLTTAKNDKGQTEIKLSPADANNPGIVTAGDQTFGGNKTFGGNTTLGSETDPATTTTVNGNVVLGAEAAKDIKAAIANNGAALKTESFITANTADNAAKALLNEVTLSVDKAKLNEEVAKTLKDGIAGADGAAATNPLADAIKAATAGTTAQAGTAVQDVKVAGAGAAAITATKDAANNVVTLDVKKATDDAAGVVTLNDVRNAVAGNGAGADRLDKGTVSKIAGNDNILDITGTPTNATFQDVQFGVTKSNVQQAVAEGLTKGAGANQALQDALAQANADALNADPANPSQKEFQDAVKGTVADGIKEGLVAGATGDAKDLADAVKDAATAAVKADGKALTSDDITVDGGANAVLNATKLTVKDGAITTAKLANDAVTSEKIKDGEVKTNDLADNAVTGAKIQDGTVTGADLAPKSVTADKLAAPAGTAAGSVPVLGADGAVAWQAPAAADANTISNKKDITSTDITVTNGAGSVVSTANVTLAIANGAITTAKLADNAVTTAKLADNAVTSAKIQDGTVTGADLADGTVATADLADAAVTSAKMKATQADGTNAPEGSIPVAGPNGTVTYKDASNVVKFGQQAFTATDAQVDFTVTTGTLPADINKVFVFRNGVKLEVTTDYTVAAGKVTIKPAEFVGGKVTAGDKIEVQFAK